MLAIEAIELTKDFGEPFRLKSMSFALPENSICAVLGPNGAGKSVLMKVLAGIFKASSGQLNLFGQPLEAKQQRKGSLIGYMPQNPSFYEWMTGFEYLTYCGRLVGFSRKELQDWILELTTFVGLNEIQQRIGSYKIPMRQKLGLAQALINQPRLLVLDNPTLHMDPQARQQMLEAIAKLKGDMTIVLSSEDIDGVGEISDHFLILRDGFMLRFQEVDNLRRSTQNDSLFLRLSGDGKLNEFISEVKSREWTDRILGSVNNKIRITVRDMAKAQRELPEIVAKKGLMINELSTMDKKLSDIYLKVVDGQ